MLARLCDRCGAPGVQVTPETSTKTLVIPKADPSTAAVAGDLEVSVGMVISKDLCAPCLVSATVEYALQSLTPALTPVVLQAVANRINQVTGFYPQPIAVAPVPVALPPSAIVPEVG